MLTAMWTNVRDDTVSYYTAKIVFTLTKRIRLRAYVQSLASMTSDAFCLSSKYCSAHDCLKTFIVSLSNSGEGSDTCILQYLLFLQNFCHLETVITQYASCFGFSDDS